MAGKWSIATKEPAGAPAASIGESDGKATFPANTSTTTDNVYTITYTDDNGCVSTTDYTVKKCTPICRCEDLDLSVSQVSWDPSETNSQTVTITSASCVTNIRVNCDNSHFSVSLGSGSITITPNSQNTSAEDIIGTVTVSYNAGSTSCSKTIRVYHNIIEVYVTFVPEIDYLGSSEGWHAHWLESVIPDFVLSSLTVGMGLIGYEGEDCKGNRLPISATVGVRGLSGGGRILPCGATGIVSRVDGPNYSNLTLSFSYNGVAKSIQSGDETEVIIGPNLERVRFSI